MSDSHLEGTVVDARNVLGALSATLVDRDARLGLEADLTDTLLGTWSASQGDLFEVMAVMDAVRANSAVTPQSLRTFLA